MWKNNIPSAHLSGPWILFSSMTSKSFSVTLKVICATEQSYEAVKIVFSQILTVHTTYSWWSSWTSKSPWDLFFVMQDCLYSPSLPISQWLGEGQFYNIKDFPVYNVYRILKYISFLFLHKLKINISLRKNKIV